MYIINEIDQLISKLNNLKPNLSDDPSSNEKKFTDLLKSAIETNYEATGTASEARPSPLPKVEREIPSWVDQDYGYDPQNPRKPNMRELMEAVSGKSVEDLYNGADKSWQQISNQASEMLYGVIGSNEDTRDWLHIMSSENIIANAREQTGAMYNPGLDIQSNFNDDGILTEQIAVIKDNKGNTLRPLSADITYAEETLKNFGATKESIPKDLEGRINPEKFNGELLAFLKNFDNNPTSTQQVVFQSATEAIANKLSQEIPLDELAKL